jgi:hypothetical protein
MLPSGYWVGAYVEGCCLLVSVHAWHRGLNSGEEGLVNSSQLEHSAQT